MKTKLKKLLSIALPVFGIVTATAVAAPLVVSCSSSSPEQKPSTPDNGGNGSGGSNNGGGSTTQTIKLSPKNKYTTWEASIAQGASIINSSDFLQNDWIRTDILGIAPEYYNLISQYITIESVEASIVSIGNAIAPIKLSAPITSLLTIGKNWKDFSTTTSVFDSLEFNSDYSFNSSITDGWKSNEKISAFISKPKNDAWLDARFIYKMNVSVKSVPVTNNTNYDISDFAGTYYFASLTRF